MNGRQIVILCVGLVVLAGMWVYCPWRIEFVCPSWPPPRSGVVRTISHTEYDWCWKPVIKPDIGRPSCIIDNDRLGLQILAWAAYLLVVFTAFRDWGTEESLDPSA